MLYVSNDIGRELYWNALIVCQYKSEINKFLILKDKFNKNLLESKFDLARDILTEIQSDFGYSNWLIENRIALPEEMEGYEKQKEFVNSITKNKDIEPIVVFLTSYFSIRAEKNVSPNKYNSRIEEVKKEFIEGNSEAEYLINLSEYMQFKLNLNNIEYYKYNVILSYESKMSLIDRYMTLIKICSHISSNTEKKEEISLIRDSIKLLDNAISDTILSSLSLRLGCYENVINDNSKDIIAVIEKYTIGDYKGCISLSEKLLNQSPFLVDIYDVYVKSLIRCLLQNKSAD